MNRLDPVSGMLVSRSENGSSPEILRTITWGILIMALVLALLMGNHLAHNFTDRAVRFLSEVSLTVLLVDFWALGIRLFRKTGRTPLRIPTRTPLILIFLHLALCYWSRHLISFEVLYRLEPMEELAGVVGEVKKDKRLDEEQGKSVVALILDPKKPVKWLGREVNAQRLEVEPKEAIKLSQSPVFLRWYERLRGRDELLLELQRLREAEELKAKKEAEEREVMAMRQAQEREAKAQKEAEEREAKKKMESSQHPPDASGEWGRVYRRYRQEKKKFHKRVFGCIYAIALVWVVFKLIAELVRWLNS